MQKKYKLLKDILDVYKILGIVALVILWVSWPIIVSELTNNYYWDWALLITIPVTIGVLWWGLGDFFGRIQKKDN